MLRNLKKYTDKELIEIIRSEAGKKRKPDSEKAFGIIYNRYSSKINAYCKYLINDEEQAEDIFQETFIRFYNSLQKDFVAINVNGFLYKTARNLCFNYNRDKKKTVPIEDLNLIIDDGKAYEKKELFDLILMALDLIDGKYKEAFILKKFNGLSIKEIAKVCNISEEGAKSRVSRSRLKIIDILEPYLKDLCK